MRLRTQLIMSAVIFGIALLIITCSIINTGQQIDRLEHQQELAKNIELKANEISYQSNDYLMYRESQQIARWNAKYDLLSRDLSNLSVDRPDQQVLVDNLKAEQLRLKDIFADVVQNIEAPSAGEQNMADITLIQLSWSRISVQTQGMVFDASRLSQKLHEQENQLRAENNMLIIVLLGVFSAFLVVNYLLIFRRTLKSILNLQEGTRIIGSGNLDHFIDDGNNDEFGELSRAFNQMTAKLKTVTASKSDLEREIVARMQVEKKLHDKSKDLEFQAEELKLAKAQAELYLDLMGHDISNMHQIAIAHLEMARESIEKKDISPEFEAMIETSLATLQRSARLIHNVRKLQQLQAGMYRSEIIDLHDLAEEVVMEYTAYPGKEVILSFESTLQAFTIANPLLKDVFVNLIDNAIKHSGDRPEIHLSVSECDDKKFYRVAVEDNGNGIPDSRKEEIFMRFSRGDTVARGTGLGLYIVRTLVESFGGQVKVEDRVAGDHTRGSRFVVLLQIAKF